MSHKATIAFPEAGVQLQDHPMATVGRGESSFTATVPLGSPLWQFFMTTSQTPVLVNGNPLVAYMLSGESTPDGGYQMTFAVR